MDYASGGKPFLKYSNPTATEILQYPHIAAEILVGPGLVKSGFNQIGKRIFKGSDDGIRSMKTIYDQYPQIPSVKIPESRRIEYKPNKIRK